MEALALAIGKFQYQDVLLFLEAQERYWLSRTSDLTINAFAGRLSHDRFTSQPYFSGLISQHNTLSIGLIWTSTVAITRNGKLSLLHEFA